MRRVVVTGWGILTSLSCDVDEVWAGVLAGESGIHHVKLFETDDIKVKIGGDLHDFDPGDAVSKKDVKKIDRYSQFAMVGAKQAVNSAGIDFSAEPMLSRCGVVLGSGIGGLTTIQEQMTRLVLKGPDRVSPMTIPKLMLNAGGGNIAIEYGLTGPNYSVATACASAANGMGNTFDLIRANVCDVMITGGTEAAMTRMGLSAFQNMKALSMRTKNRLKQAVLLIRAETDLCSAKVPGFWFLKNWNMPSLAAPTFWRRSLDSGQPAMRATSRRRLSADTEPRRR